jgi:hypothetical protein
VTSKQTLSNIGIGASEISTVCGLNPFSVAVGPVADEDR